MRRRDFIARLGAAGACAAVPRVALAQQGTRVRKTFKDLVQAGGWRQINGPLFRKYVALFLALVFVVLLINDLLEIGIAYQQHKVSLIRIQREQTEAVAAKIGQFIKEIESQIGWTTQLPWSTGTMEQRKFDGSRVLRQVLAITEFAQLDATGKEQLHQSKLAMDVENSQIDFSHEAKFTEAVAKKVYYGPVYFRGLSEPYMTLALAGIRRDAGVSVAEVNLKLIWDVISQIKVGEHGQAYVVDDQGRLIAHPDISLVLRNTDMTGLAQVKAARAAGGGAPSEPVQIGKDLQGREVLTAYAPVAPLGWLVFAELPVDEAYAPLYEALERSGALLLAGLVLAFLAALFLARRMVVPIQTIGAGAARIGSGDLTQRISIRTGDEIEALAEQFNHMAEQLQDSYADLEERTHQKSRFLAAASHDLRQPMHALGLFVAQLHSHIRSPDGSRVVDRIDEALTGMNELFNALLDITKLDAGALTPTIREFPIAELLGRIGSTFAPVAQEKGLSFRSVPSSAWVRSDQVLLERIVLNLVSNAVRYTAAGGIVVGCRYHKDHVRIEVCDSGPGIPPEQQRKIFGEFYRLADAAKSNQAGLGLGLAIVDRLCALLDHPIELTSTLGRGSRFGVTVPTVPARAAEQPKIEPPPQDAIDAARGKLVVVIDNDVRVLEGMGGLLRTWGCRVVAAMTPEAALADVSEFGAAARPNLVIADFHLGDGQTGITAIAKLREAHGAIPAFVMTGDIAPERLREARENGHHLLHKPVQPMTLRAMVSRMLKSEHVMR
jgi:signal transduction histidine kinase/CheY-like chemotaxis protein